MRRREALCRRLSDERTNSLDLWRYGATNLVWVAKTKRDIATSKGSKPSEIQEAAAGLCS